MVQRTQWALLSALTCSTWSGQQLRADRQADETDGWRLGIQKPEGALTKDNHQPRLTEAMATLGREEGEKAKRQVCAALVPQPLSKACIVQWPGEGQVTHFLMKGAVRFASLSARQVHQRGSQVLGSKLHQPQAGRLVNFREDARLCAALTCSHLSAQLHLQKPAPLNVRPRPSGSAAPPPPVLYRRSAGSHRLLSSPLPAPPKGSCKARWLRELLLFMSKYK